MTSSVMSNLFLPRKSRHILVGLIFKGDCFLPKIRKLRFQADKLALDSHVCMSNVDVRFKIISKVLIPHEGDFFFQRQKRL